jgi:hypothetical protein
MKIKVIGVAISGYFYKDNYSTSFIELAPTACHGEPSGAVQSAHAYTANRGDLNI